MLDKYIQEIEKKGVELPDDLKKAKQALPQESKKQKGIDEVQNEHPLAYANLNADIMR
jgi:hypothetical protein